MFVRIVSPSIVHVTRYSLLSTSSYSASCLYVSCRQVLSTLHAIASASTSSYSEAFYSSCYCYSNLLYVSIFTTALQMLAIVCYVMCILAATGILVDSVDRWIVALVVLLFEDLVIFEPAKVMVAAAYWSLEKDSLPYY